MSIRQRPPSFAWLFPTPSNTAKRSRSRELHPFIEYATMLDMALSRKLARRGIDIDNVRGFEHDAPAIDVHRPDMRRLHKIRRSASGEFAIEFAVDQHSSTGARVLLRGRQIASQGILRLRVSRPAPKMLASIMLILAAPFAELLEHNSSRSDKRKASAEELRVRIQLPSAESLANLRRSIRSPKILLSGLGAACATRASQKRSTRGFKRSHIQPRNRSRHRLNSPGTFLDW
ncbi:MAG: hypothetical protein QOD29_3025 [Alphaproteobacteria bacterium]|nr:hypothetical protein [Alphaproteobacteria bacterium]